MPRRKLNFENSKKADPYTPYEKYGIGQIYKCADCKNSYINHDWPHPKMVEAAKKRRVDLSQAKIVCEFCFKANYS